MHILAWLLRILGISSEITDHLADATFSLQRPTVLWVGLALLVPVGLFIHRRQCQRLTVSPALRNTLTACRVAVLALMVTMFASPSVRLDHTLEKRSIVAIVLDHSRSMNLPAGPFETESSVGNAARAIGWNGAGQIPVQIRESLDQMSRSQMAHAALDASASTLIGPIRERFELQVFEVAEELTPIPIGPVDVELGEPPQPGGKRSAIGTGLEQVIEQAGGRQLSGIILLSDGQNNGGASLAQAAAIAEHAHAPIYAVPAGSTTRIADLAIADVFTSGVVSLGDTVRVSVTVESFGFDGRTVPIELREGDITLDSKTLVLQSAEQQQVELSFEATRAGAHYLSVRATPFPDERIGENNQDTAFVRVDDQKIKVLYVEGLPRWDFRFLKNGMRRDHGLDPAVLSAIDSGSSGSKTIPSTVDGWAEYRTIVLGDCSAELLTPPCLTALVEAVRDRGVGLIVAAGPNYMPHAYQSTELAELLPVRSRRDTAGYDAASQNPFKIELTPAGSVHDALRLHEEPGRNTALWENMSPYFWCAAVVRAAPGATVLATNPSIEDRFGKLPLIAYHYAGSGKVLFVGTDSTWLWRENVGDRYFYKFWGQMLRFVARRDEKDRTKNTLEIRPLRAQPGETAEIELWAFAADGTGRIEPEQSVTVTLNDRSQPVTLKGDSENPGRYIGRYSPKSEGTHQFRFEPADAAEHAEAELHVEYAAEELRRPNVDRTALELLSNQTGGQVIELSELANIPDRLHGDAKYIEIHREETIWDNWLSAVVIALIYSIDVGIRRLTGLS